MKPMRPRVEVIIINPSNQKVLITINAGDRNPVWYGFPGGGVEENQTRDQAVVAEAREEVQCVVRPGRVVAMHVEQGYKSSAAKRYREKMYSGSITEYVLADLVKEHCPADTSDGDETKYQWFTLHEAISLLNRALYPPEVIGPNGERIQPPGQETARPRLEALKKLA